MIQDRKRVATVGNGEDRLSDLPRNVIDDILELLSAKDAARTSILSRKWRYIWAMIPYLVLDEDDDIFQYRAVSFFRETVYTILLQHLGDIIKFVLYIPKEFASYTDLDRWLLYVTRNGVKKLTLMLYSNDNPYKLPSYVFNCTTLTHLDLRYCVFKPLDSFVHFQSLTTLQLFRITFSPTKEFCVINTPLLVSLHLQGCDGTQYLKIVSPKVETLHAFEIHYLLLNCFLNCQKLRDLVLCLDNVFDKLKHDGRTTLEKLISSSAATLEELHFGSIALELLSEDTVSKEPPFMLNCLWDLSLTVNFEKLSESSTALQFIWSAPNLNKLKILIKGFRDNAGAVSEYVSTPTCLDRQLTKLKHLVTYCNKGSNAELVFLKLLFARTPSLVKISIRNSLSLGSEEKPGSAISKLMCFPKASPKAKLFLNGRLLSCGTHSQQHGTLQAELQ